MLGDQFLKHYQNHPTRSKTSLDVIIDLRLDGKRTIKFFQKFAKCEHFLYTLHTFRVFTISIVVNLLIGLQVEINRLTLLITIRVAL